MIAYILITLVFSFGYTSSLSYYREEETAAQSSVRYMIYKSKEELAREIKECDKNPQCRIVGLVACDRLSCKEYDYSLKTEPKIKDTVELSKKMN